MIGFGFMDNLVMIQAGDMIDNSIDVTFCLSTLTAAALGQVVSDRLAYASADARSFSHQLGLPSSTMTNAQLKSKAFIFSTGCATVGVILGCVLGMTCLLFMDLEKADREKKRRNSRLSSIRLWRTATPYWVRSDVRCGFSVMVWRVALDRLERSKWR